MLSASLNWPPVGVPGPAVYGLPSPPATCAGIDQWSCNWYTPKALAVPIKLTNKWRSPMFSHTLSDNLLKIPLRWPFLGSAGPSQPGMWSSGHSPLESRAAHQSPPHQVEMSTRRDADPPSSLGWFQGGSDGNP